MSERRVFEGEVHDYRDQGGRMWLQPDGSKRSMVLLTAFVKDLGGKRVRVMIEPADAPDPILAWLEREAALARRVLEAERDPGDIEIMRQWVYHHECMVSKRLDELGLLDVDDEPTGGEHHE